MTTTIGHGWVRAVRKTAVIALILISFPFFVFGDSYWPDEGLIENFIQWAGIVLIVICVFGRTWCSLYVGGRKKRELVVHGPYSVTRNPLYFFSFLGAAGAGAMTGSIAIAIVVGFAVLLLFSFLVLREEKVLLASFGSSYQNYCASVPRFFPDFRLWHDRPMLSTQSRTVWFTFVDSSLFLLAIPILHVLDALRDGGILPILFSLP